MYAPVAQLGRGAALKTLKVWVRILLGVFAEYYVPWHAHVPQSGRGTRPRTVTVRVRFPS